MAASVLTAEITEPYAQALISIAQEHDLVDNIAQDVQGLLDLLETSVDLKEFLANPVLQAEAKKAALQQIVGEQVHTYTLNFLKLLADRGRISFLDKICHQYQTILRQLRNIALAEITSTVDLTDAQQQALKDKVKSVTGAQDVELILTLDPELIGGVVVKIGSQVIDLSLRGQLRRISLRLLSSSEA